MRLVQTTDTVATEVIQPGVHLENSNNILIYLYKSPIYLLNYLLIKYPTLFVYASCTVLRKIRNTDLLFTYIVIFVFARAQITNIMATPVMQPDGNLENIKNGRALLFSAGELEELEQNPRNLNTTSRTINSLFVWEN